MSRLIYLLFSFEGRIGRLSFFLGGLAQSLLLMILWIYPVVVLASLEKGARLPSGLLMTWIVPTILAGLWMGLALISKRYHDRGKSGWWYLVTFIPLIGPIWVFIELQFLSGDRGANRFGPPPGGGDGVSYDALREDVRKYADKPVAARAEAAASAHDIRSKMAPQPVVTRVTRTPIGNRPVTGFGKRGLT